MKRTYYIIGPGIPTDKENLKELYSKNRHEVKVIGDGINPVNINDYNLDEATDIIINAHGCKNQGIHAMALYSSDPEIQDIYYTRCLFSDIALGTNNNPVNVEIYSCYGEKAIDDVNALPIGSILMSSDSSDRYSFNFFHNDIIAKVASLPDLNNPFMKFVVYLLTNPDNNSFAIRLYSNGIIVTSSMDSLEDYSKNGLDEWRNKEIDSFIELVNSTLKLGLRTLEHMAYCYYYHQYKLLCANQWR